MVKSGCSISLFLAYELYRRAGVPAPLTDYIRLSVDDKSHGYYLLIEQPTRTFLRRNRRTDSGNLYKLIWYEHGVEGQHEKKTNRNTGHADIVSLVETLKRTEGVEQWNVQPLHSLP
jgi:spore coat protein CotH